MKSILDGRPELKAVVYQIAEVTGYLWQKGWAERNGGNITVNVTEMMDDTCKTMPAITPAKQIGMTLPQLKGKYFYCKGTGKRMRDLASASVMTVPRMRSSPTSPWFPHQNYLPTWHYRTICSRQAPAIRPHSTHIPLNWWR